MFKVVSISVFILSLYLKRLIINLRPLSVVHTKYDNNLGNIPIAYALGVIET